MKPPPFSYAAPDTVEEVLDLLAEHGEDAVVIAGGQSLVPLLNLRLAQPSVVVDPRRCAELRQLALDADGLRAGAMVTAGEVERSPSATTLPGLREALANVGHVQIRNRGTLGGMAAHADPAAEVPAYLVACGGTLTLRSRERGTRTVRADDFFLGPFTTARRPDELLTEVRAPRFGGPMAIRELASRPGDFATVGVIVGVTGGGNGVRDARIVVFGAGSRAERMTEAEVMVQEGAPVADVVQSVRRHTTAFDDAHASAAYRRHVAGTLAGRALADVTGRGAGPNGG